MSEIEDENISDVIDIDIYDKTLIVSAQHDEDDGDVFRVLFYRLNE